MAYNTGVRKINALEETVRQLEATIKKESSMGYMTQHAIIVTSWESELLKEAHRKAVTTFDSPVSMMSPETVNGYRSFFVAPDGSKEGWPESEAGDNQRDSFIEWMEGQRSDDDYRSSLSWVEVQYGDEDYETKIIRDSDQYARERTKGDNMEIPNEIETGDGICFHRAEWVSDCAVKLAAEEMGNSGQPAEPWETFAHRMFNGAEKFWAEFATRYHKPFNQESNNDNSGRR
jgi:hypothetical protein